jgi:hypothetical protein
MRDDEAQLECLVPTRGLEPPTLSRACPKYPLSSDIATTVDRIARIEQMDTPRRPPLAPRSM